jgi:hypothetical protein
MKIYVNEQLYEKTLVLQHWLDMTYWDFDGMVEAYTYPRELTLGSPFIEKDNPTSCVNYLYYDDLYLSDEFEGDLGIDVINPMANALVGWSPTVSTNWEDVYGITQKQLPFIYREKSTSNLDKWEMENISGNQEIIAIQGVFIGSKNFPSEGTIKPVYNNDIGSSGYFDNSPLIKTDCRDNYIDSIEVPGDPPTEAVPWTTETINDLQFGVIGAP